MLALYVIQIGSHTFILITLIELTPHTVYEQTLRREQALRDEGYNVVSIWGHEFDQQLKNQEELQTLLEHLDFQDPLNAICLFCKEGDF